MKNYMFSKMIYETFKEESPEFISSIERAVSSGMPLSDLRKIANKHFENQPVTKGIAITVSEYLFHEQHKN